MTTPQAKEDLENSEETSENAPSLNIFQFSSLASLSPDRRESLETFHRRFLMVVPGIITDLLRLDTTWELGSIEVQTYGEAVARREDDNQGILFRMHPQPGNCLLDIPIPLALLMIDRMMGGGTVALVKEPSELTVVEQAILQQFAEVFLAAYARVWLPYIELRPEILKQERHLNQRRLPDAGEITLQVEFKGTIKEGKATIRLIIPIAAVEDLLLRWMASENEPAEESEVKDVKDKKSLLGSVPIPVSLRWQGFQISLREVNEMAVGDLLMLDNKKCQTAAIWLSDMAKFTGRVAREPKKTTVTITGTLT